VEFLREWGELPTAVADATPKYQNEVSTTCVSGWDKVDTYMWNDTELPLGYLITFRCYGTWLHGDERGSIDRFHNRYQAPYLPCSDRRRDLNRRQLRSEPLILDARQRQSIDLAVREVCV